MANDKKDLTSTAASKRQQRKIEQQRAERRKRLLMIVGGVVAVAIVAVVVLIIVNNRGDSSNLPDVQAATAPDASIPVNGMTIGDANAPVKIVEYGDYQCPFCAEFNKDAMPPLLADYVATGKVQLTFVPFSFLGDESLAAAEAAFCANDQGKFWAMHETIYANHNGENIGNLSDSRLREMAQKSGLDMDQYDACVDAGTHQGDVQNANATARTAGIASTPSFVINNGDPIGYASWDDFKAEIDDALGTE